MIARRIGLIVAMEKELRLLLPHIEGLSSKLCGTTTIYHGTIADKQICVIKCGVGKVNAAIRCDELIRAFTPDLIINTGVAGGADVSMHVLDLLVASGVAYHDVWCGPGTEPGAASGFERILSPSEELVQLAKDVMGDNTGIDRLKTGLLCSGDIFVSRVEEVNRIKWLYPNAVAVDMESGAIAQVCTMRGVPFGVIRVISDTPGQQENISQYENFWTDAPAEIFKALTTIIGAIRI